MQLTKKHYLIGAALLGLYLWKKRTTPTGAATIAANAKPAGITPGAPDDRMTIGGTFDPNVM